MQPDKVGHAAKDLGYLYDASAISHVRLDRMAFLHSGYSRSCRHHPSSIMRKAAAISFASNSS